MRDMTEHDIPDLLEVFSVAKGTGWQEVKIELHAHNNETPVFILLRRNADIATAARSAMEPAKWYLERFRRPNLTISFQMLDEHFVHVVAYVEGSRLLDELARIQPFNPPQRLPKELGSVFESSISLGAEP